MQPKITFDQGANKEPQLIVNCISCGSSITENYCSVCGERKFDRHDLTLPHLAEESFEGITHFDNKFFRSAKLLFTKPGLLSDYFCTGKRMPYMRPFALFFVCNLLFFLIIGESNVFSLSLYNFYKYTPYTNFHTKEIILQLAHDESSFGIVTRSFNEKMGIQSKSFLVFFIPFLALGGILIKRKSLLSEHLVFSTHYFSFIILYYTLAQLLISVPFYYLMNQNYNSTFDLGYSLCALTVFMIYYWIAAKRFYKVSNLKAAFGAIFVAFLFVMILYAYRFFLFFKIISSISI
jgi:hypothetical protein